jgi:translation initiation factor 5B
MITGQWIVLPTDVNLTLCSRENAGEVVDPIEPASADIPDDDGLSSSKPRAGFSAFASFADTGDVGAFDEEEDGGGGLMVCIRVVP